MGLRGCVLMSLGLSLALNLALNLALELLLLLVVVVLLHWKTSMISAAE